MKKMITKLLCLSFIFAFVLSFSNNAYANPELKFSVKPVFESHQIDKTSAFYNLKVDKGEKLNLAFTIENKTQEEITVYLQGANGLTSIYGGRQYLNNSGNQYAKFLDTKYLFRKYIELPESITLMEQEKKEVKFTVNVPNEDLGTVLGGLIFSTHNPKEKMNGANQNYQVDNQPEFNLAILMNFNDSENLTEEVAIKKVHSQVISGHPVVFVNIQNHSTKLLNDLNIKYEVYEKEGNDKGAKLFEGNLTNFEMAPQTEVITPIAWQSKEFKSGDFLIIVNAKYFGKKLQYKEAFKVEQKTVVEYSKQIKDTKPQPVIDDGNAKWFSKIMNNQYIIFILGMLVVLLLGIVLGRKTKKEEKETKENTEKEIDDNQNSKTEDNKK